MNIGAKRTLIKQPPPKKAQRQFERMWNVAKPGGADDYDDETFEESGSFRRSKASLLGPPPRSLLSTKRADSGLYSFQYCIKSYYESFFCIIGKHNLLTVHFKISRLFLLYEFKNRTEDSNGYFLK